MEERGWRHHSRSSCFLFMRLNEVYKINEHHYEKSVLTTAIAALSIFTSGTVQACKGSAETDSYVSGQFVVATEHGVPCDGRTDAAEAIQRLIVDNPNKTIFFPDGVYMVSRPIDTPAEPTKSVSLVLGNYAVLKAAESWVEGEAIVRLGAIEKANNINVNGSNYGIYGGIIDGSGVADGISIDGGRETKIENVSIKHVRVGVHIKYGANSGSSDADVSDVNITGNGKVNSIGLLVEGHDNTFTNMRIADVHIGVHLKTGGNSLRNIHPLYIFGKDQVYDSSCGFVIAWENNFLNYCYSDQFATGFKIGKGLHVNLTDCFCWWYSGKVPFQTAIECEGTLESMITGLQVGFHKDCQVLTLLKAEKGGKGQITNFILPENKYAADDASAFYIK